MIEIASPATPQLSTDFAMLNAVDAVKAIQRAAKSRVHIDV